MPQTSSLRLQDLEPGTVQAKRLHLTYDLGGGINEKGIFYTLMRDEKLLHLQMAPIQLSDFGNAEKRQKAYTEHRITHLQSMVSQLEFGDHDWAYHFRNNDGTDRFVYKRKPLVVTKYLWAPLIEESDIKFKYWTSSVCFREGWWNGQEVDIFEDTEEEIATYQNEGHLLMQNRGLKHLTFPLLGHLARGGLVVGNVFEAAIGRLIEYRDRAAVYEAVALIQSKHIIMQDIFAGDILVDKAGSVRFTRSNAAKYISDVEELEKQGNICHWAPLQEIFDGIKPGGKKRLFTLRGFRRPGRHFIVPPLPTLYREASVDWATLEFSFSLSNSSYSQWYDWIDSLSNADTQPHENRLALSSPSDLARRRRRRAHSHAQDDADENEDTITLITPEVAKSQRVASVHRRPASRVGSTLQKYRDADTLLRIVKY